MKAGWRRSGIQAASSLWRTVAFTAFAAKLLIPVGFMPAALADGGPFVLCEAGQAHADSDLPANPAGNAFHHAGDASLHHAGDASPHADTSGAPVPHHDESGAHHEWERCALGALASLAAVGGDWPAVLPASGSHEPPLSTVHRLLAQRTPTGFHARAPPLRTS